MKPPIECVTDRVELADRINRCIDDTVYFAEQFLDYKSIVSYPKCNALTATFFVLPDCLPYLHTTNLSLHFKNALL